MRKASSGTAAQLWTVLAASPAVPPGRVIQNVIVYREPGRYGGWPANHGIWQWRDETLVGFEAGYFKYNDHTHSIDWDRPAEHLLLRSLDGGETWRIEHPLSLRAPDGETWDLGYTRTVQRRDGKLVTVYYFNDDRNKERYIGATIWEAY